MLNDCITIFTFDPLIYRRGFILVTVNHTECVTNGGRESSFNSLPISFQFAWTLQIYHHSELTLCLTACLLSFSIQKVIKKGQNKNIPTVEVYSLHKATHNEKNRIKTTQPLKQART